MITLIKIGGSLITNKNIQNTFRQDVMQRLAHEIRQILDETPQQIIIGHGSGSFGHFEAKKHGTDKGATTSEQWHGFAKVAFAAATLSHLVTQELNAIDIPVFRFQPSASIQTQKGIIQHLALQNIQLALEHGLVPLVHGDVAFDTQQGVAIASTETVFTYLVGQLPVSKIILLGEVDGVYDNEKQVIPHIHTQNYEQFKSALGGSEGVDVTGGMLTKVSDMLALAQKHSGLKIRISNGLTPNLLIDAIHDKTVGTLITA
jgi:isopentenyl phosphate kinase